MECKNCQMSPLSDADKFCHACGAKVIRNRLNDPKYYGATSANNSLNYGQSVFKDVRWCFDATACGLSAAYVNGTRKKYVNVLSYFALALTLSGIQIFVIRKFFTRSPGPVFELVPGNVTQGVLRIWIGCMTICRSWLSSCCRVRAR